MKERRTFTVAEDEAGVRLDVFLAGRMAEYSRSSIATMMHDGTVLVDGAPAKPSQRTLAGQHIVFNLSLRPALSAAPEAIPLVVVYQDDDVAVIDKPAGMVVHPAGGHPGGTLANALTSLFPQTQSVGDALRPGIVHRLDKDTSGLIAVALSSRGMRSLRAQIESRAAQRIYLALATGAMTPQRGSIDAPIGRDPADRTRMTVHGVAPRTARTDFEVLREFTGFSLIRASLQTGRTHQIRVHFAAAGHPLAGDSRYGGASLPGLRRQFLHAHELSFSSPATGTRLSFSSALPHDLAQVLAVLEDAAPSLE